MLLQSLISGLFGIGVFSKFTPAFPQPPYRGPTPPRKSKFGSSNAERRKALHLPAGKCGNKLAVRTSKCKVGLSVIK